jgi:hypothetical protein
VQSLSEQWVLTLTHSFPSDFDLGSLDLSIWAGDIEMNVATVKIVKGNTIEVQLVPNNQVSSTSQVRDLLVL